MIGQHGWEQSGDLRVVIGEVRAIPVAWIETNPPHPRAHELDQEKRLVVETEDSSMATGRMFGSILQQLVSCMVADFRRLAHARSGSINISKEVVGLLEDVRVSKLGCLKVAHAAIV